jgi:hypothetical protein
VLGVSDDVNEKLAVELEPPDGGPDVIVVFGAIVSTVNGTARAATLPAASTATTVAVCAPSATPV